MTSRTPLQQPVAKSLVGGGVLALAVGLASIVGCTASTPAAPTDTARVERVADGDTLVLRGGSRVRLVQVDAPELGQGECYGAASKRVLGRLVQVGARVELEARPGTRPARSLRPPAPLRAYGRRERECRARPPWRRDAVLSAWRTWPLRRSAQRRERGRAGRAPRNVVCVSGLLAPGPTGRDPSALSRSLVRGTSSRRNRTFGSAGQDLKWAPGEADHAQL